MRKYGFTLANTIVIFIMLAVLVAILWPLLHDHHSDTVYREIICMRNQRLIAIAIPMYCQDNGERYFPDPKNKAWAVYLKEYNEPSLYDCPTFPGNGSNANPEYGFNANLFEKGTRIQSPETTLLTADLATGGMTGNYSFTDANSASPTYFEKILDPRHNYSGLAYSAADGHVAIVRVPKGATLAAMLKSAGMQFAVTVKKP